MVVVYTMLDVRNHDHIGRATQIRMTVETAAGVLALANQLETSGKMPREEAQSLAKQAIAQLRYGKDAYFFISDMESPAKFIMHPITPERNGQAAPSSNGPELLETFAKKVRSETLGFVSYRGREPAVTGQWRNWHLTGRCGWWMPCPRVT